MFCNGLANPGQYIFSHYLRNLVSNMKTGNTDFLHGYHFSFVRGVASVRGMGYVECQIIMRIIKPNKLHLL